MTNEATLMGLSTSYETTTASQLEKLTSYEQAGDLDVRIFIATGKKDRTKPVDFLNKIEVHDSEISNPILDGLSRFKAELISHDNVARMSTQRGLFLGGAAVNPAERLGDATWQYMSIPRFSIREVTSADGTSFEVSNAIRIPLEKLGFTEGLSKEQIAGYITRFCDAYAQSYSPQEILGMLQLDGRLKKVPSNEDIMMLLSNATTLRVLNGASEERATVVFTDDAAVNGYLKRYLANSAPSIDVQVDRQRLSIELTGATAVALDIPTNPVDFANGLRVSVVLKPHN